MKKGIGGLIILVIAGVALWAMGKGPAKVSAVPLGSVKGPAGETPTATDASKLIIEVPPPDIQRYTLGATQYVKFTSPISLGSGFTQWGVTDEGFPVVSTKPPENYEAWEWW